MVLVVFGIPAIQTSTPQSKTNGVHVIDGVLTEKEEIVIGEFKPIARDELSEDEEAFVGMAVKEGGVYRKGDLFVVSLKGMSPDQSFSFIQQENHSNEVRLYVKKVKNASHSDVLLGRMKLSEDFPFSFIDADTGALIF